MADVVDLTLWPELDKLLKEAEREQARTWNDPRLQARLLHTLGSPNHGYWQLTGAQRQAVVARLINLVPRVSKAGAPTEVVEELFLLYRHPEPFEQISRAVKVSVIETERPYSDEEKVYQEVGGLLGVYLDWCRHSDVPLAYYFWSGVLTLGAACRYNFFIDRGIDKWVMNQYMIFVGHKATGKSSALQASNDILRRVNYHINRWAPGDADKVDFTDDHPWHIRLLPEDTNQETLVRELHSYEVELQLPAGFQPTIQMPERIPWDSTGVLFFDELATFLGRDVWAVQKRVPFLTTLFGRPDYNYKTQKGGFIPLRNTALSMLGCCTPDYMREAISPLLFGGGFFDRTTICYRQPLPTRTFPDPLPRDPVVANWLARQLIQFSCRLNREELVPTPAAREWHNDWYLEFPEPLDETGTSVKRRSMHTWKLAAIFALSDGTAPVIDRHHFELADRILTIEDSHFIEFVQAMDKPMAQDHMEFIERALYQLGGPEWISQAKLYNRLRKRRGLSPPATKAKEFLQSLQQSDRIKFRRGPTGAAEWRLSKGVANELAMKGPLVGKKAKLQAVPEPTDEPETDDNPDFLVKENEK